AMHDLEPAALREKPLGFTEQPALALEQLHLMPQRLRDRHRARIVPKWRVAALRRVVMQDDEVADVLELAPRQPVVLVDVGLARHSGGKEMQEGRDRALD